MRKLLEKELRYMKNRFSAQILPRTTPPVFSEEEQKQGYTVLDELFVDEKISHREIALNCHLDCFNRYPYPHRHDFFEMIYVFSGKMYNTIEGQQTVLSPGDFLLLNPSVIHMPVTDSGTLSLNILFRKELFQKTFSNLLLNNNLFADFFIKSLREKIPPKKYLFFAGEYINEEQMLPCLYLLLKESAQNDAYVNQNIQNLISCIFAELTRADLKKQEYLRAQQKKTISMEEIVRYICQNFHTATLESTASHFGYHPKYLSSLLSRQYGKTFSEIRRLYRIQYAAALLLESSLSVSEVIAKAGYTNNSYFYRIFKDTFQVSPTEYRLDHKGHNLLAYFPGC